MSSSNPYNVDLSQTETNQLTAIADAERKRKVKRNHHQNHHRLLTRNLQRR